MKAWLKIAATVLGAGPIAIFFSISVSAQALSDVTAVLPDTLCDYCKDFTDAATSAGAVRSAYRPGVGYATEPHFSKGSRTASRFGQGRARSGTGREATGYQIEMNGSGFLLRGVRETAGE
jgi:hypothetical protein